VKITWEHLIDYARGIASPQVAAAIESDPASMKEVELLRRVHKASREEAPENWVQRAKALIPNLAKSTSPLRGRLVFQSAGPVAGFRSGTQQARQSRYEFDDATLEIRVEKESSGVRIAGVYESAAGSAVTVGTEKTWLTTSDEDGQFTMVLPEGEKILRLQVLEDGPLLEVEIENEDEKLDPRS